MVKLIHRFLKLAVKDTAVGYNNHRLKNLIILFVMQTRKPVSKPGDRIGLARTGTMLNQVVFSAAVCFHIGNQLRDHIKLMKAGENQTLGFDLAGLFVLFGL